MAASLESEFFETKGFDQEQEAMMKMMGFGSFESTQGEKVRGNEEGTVKVKSTRQVRQFMNRRGGFNRPLPAERTGQKLNDL
jgi:U4/U6.U5 tri-snRNP-associated protein 3